MKQYKAIFFDWDGTAVMSRRAPVDDVIGPMKALLKKGIPLVIVSGTTIQNLAGGKLHEYFTPEELSNLYLGLGRGAFNYAYGDNGKPYVFSHRVPDRETLLTIHRVCYEIHAYLYENYGFPTDIVFSRPNYCKIDLMVENNRGEQLFFQENELDTLKKNLMQHGFSGGLKGMTDLAETISANYGLTLSSTTDAKYLEVGLSSKSDNVDTIFEHLREKYTLCPKDCAFWGDEYIGLDESLYGSDSFMITDITREGDFFDVSEAQGKRPKEVKVVGGGVSRFLTFLKEQEG